MTIPASEQIARSSERWRLCGGEPETALLRLAILRELVRLVHAEKSHYLATGKRDQIPSLKALETRITELRSAAILEGELQDLIEGKAQLRKRTRLLPEALFGQIEREKLERYDRQWEAAIAAEAAHLGWSFWSLEAWVQISLVEEWNRQLTESLWPHALVLYVESSEVQAPESSGPQPLWHGRWVMVVHPRFRSGADLSLNLDRFAGAPDGPAPGPAQWKLLYLPKKR